MRTLIFIGIFFTFSAFADSVVPLRKDTTIILSDLKTNTLYPFNKILKWPEIYLYMRIKVDTPLVFQAIYISPEISWNPYAQMINKDSVIVPFYRTTHKDFKANDRYYRLEPGEYLLYLLNPHESWFGFQTVSEYVENIKTSKNYELVSGEPLVTTAILPNVRSQPKVFLHDRNLLGRVETKVYQFK